MSNNMYDILNKLKSVTDTAESVQLTESADAVTAVRGPLAEKIAKLESQYAEVKEAREFKSKDEFDDKAQPGDWCKTANGKLVKTASGVRHERGAAKDDSEELDEGVTSSPRGTNSTYKAGQRAIKNIKSKNQKPDYLDLDKDGDKTEPMKKAAKEVKEGREFSSKDKFDDKAQPGDWYKSSQGKVVKTASGVRHERGAAKDDSEELDESMLNEYSEDEYANAMRDFRSKGGRVTTLPAGSAKNPISTASRHIAGRGEAGKGKPAGRGAKVNATGKPVVDVYEDDLNELSPNTLASYAGKARGQGQWAQGVASPGGGVSDRDSAAYAKLANKRFAGAKAAEKKAGMEPGEAGSTSYDWQNKGGYGDKNTPAKKYGAVNEKAPPGAKAERMVKHIKKGYADDGNLTKREKGIAYATAWKAHNKGQVEEGVEFGDTIENSKAELKKAKKVKVTEGAIRNHPIYTTQEAWDHYSKELAEQEAMEAKDFFHNPAVPSSEQLPPTPDAIDVELDEIARLAGLTPAKDELPPPPPHKEPIVLEDELEEEEMEEGNEFSGALAKAKAAGAKEFEVDGKKYTVKEDVNLTADTVDDVVGLIRKLAGLETVEQQPATSLAPTDTVIDMPADDMSFDGMSEERDIEFANTPDELVAPLAAATPNGTDLHRAKKSYSDKPYRGDNPMSVQENVEDGLWKKYSGMLKGLLK